MNVQLWLGMDAAEHKNNNPCSHSSYHVDKRRNYDGEPPWIWILWIDDYAWDSYRTETEAWAAAEQHQAEGEPI
jgi:hypothetical protein